jgi:hypothetical protein
MSELIQLRNQLHNFLSDAQDKFRKTYAGTTKWIDKEHEAMLNEVNRHLTERGRPVIALEELRKAEQLALGHSDYSSKFALYCAEIILGTHKGIP